MSNSVAKKPQKPRVVPAFTVQSQQRNTITAPPPNSNVFKPELNKLAGKTTLFRKLYDRGDFPIQLEHTARGIRLQWKIPTEQVDIGKFLPTFLEGVLETAHPYGFIAEQGSLDMIECGGLKLLPTIPFLISPIKRCLNTKIPDKIRAIIRILQKLTVSSENAGPALVPYYRQILPVLGLFINRNINIGDKIEYGQTKHQTIGDLIVETLNQLERTGGPNAFINIKYVIPTYETCMGSN